MLEIRAIITAIAYPSIIIDFFVDIHNLLLYNLYFF